MYLSGYKYEEYSCYITTASVLSNWLYLCIYLLLFCEGKSDAGWRKKVSFL